MIDLRLQRYVMADAMSKARDARDFLSSRIQFDPEIGVVLGTGLGKLTREIQKVGEVAYDEIPDFPVSTVENCLRDKLVFGSDFPRVWFKTMVDAVKGLGLSDECLHLIFRKNAEKLLHLS